MHPQQLTGALFLVCIGEAASSRAVHLVSRISYSSLLWETLGFGFLVFYNQVIFRHFSVNLH